MSDICCFRVVAFLPLHLVVNWPVFTICVIHVCHTHSIASTAHGQQPLTVLVVAADWFKLMIPQCIVGLH